MLSGCPGHLSARKTEASIQGTLLRGEKRPSTSHLGTTNNHQKCTNTRWNRILLGENEVVLRLPKAGYSRSTAFGKSINPTFHR